MNILFKLNPEFTAIHGFIYDDRYFDIENILFFIEESEIEYKNHIAAAVLLKFYSISSLSPKVDIIKILDTYNFFAIGKLSNNIYENIFNEFFEYAVIADESDLLNDFKPYIKVSKNNSCSYCIETILYTHQE